MIPHVETIIRGEIERRIVAALPGTAPSDGTTPETFVITAEERKVTPCVQDQDDVTIFCTVEVVFSVLFYSRKMRYDYSPLLADMAKNPHLALPGPLHARIRWEESVAVDSQEGPHLTCEGWMVRVEYEVFELHEGTPPSGIAVGWVVEGGARSAGAHE